MRICVYVGDGAPPGQAAFPLVAYRDTGHTEGGVMALLDAADISELHARVCKALADPKRLLIINELRDGPRSVGELADALGVSQPNVSRHLAVLRDRGFVTAERFGSSVHYSLASPKVLRAVDLLREFMAEELGARPARRLLAADTASAGR